MNVIKSYKIPLFSSALREIIELQLAVYKIGYKLRDLWSSEEMIGNDGQFPKSITWNKAGNYL